MKKYPLRTSLILVAIFLVFMGVLPFAWAAQIRLAWDANTEPDLAGYKLYYGTVSHSYGTPVNVGNVTAYTLAGLTQGQTYYLSLTAYDTSDNESDHSSEVSGAATDPVQNVTITIATNPTGRQVVVDGTSYAAPQNFTWVVGASHSLSVSSPQNGTTGTRYVYGSWSDGGGQTHNITVPSTATTYTASFTTQYSLTTAIAASGGGTVTPSGETWHNSGATVQVTATPNSGYSFSGWSGDASGTANPLTITMSGRRSVTASFSAIAETVSTPTTPSGQTSGSTTTSYSYSTGGASSNLGHTLEYRFDWGDGTYSAWSASTSASKSWTSAGSYSVRGQARCASHNAVVSAWSSGLTVTIIPSAVSCTVTTSPSSLAITVDGAPYTAPRSFDWAPGSSHSISVSSPQNGTVGTRYVYSSWNDGGGQTHTVTIPTMNVTYTANFTIQHTLTTSADPSAGGTVNPSGEHWYTRGDNVDVTATPNGGYNFTGWSGSASGTTNPVRVTVDGVKTVTAGFSQSQYTLTVNVSPSSSGSVSKSPNQSTYGYGEQVILTATANSGVTFNQWTGDVTGTMNPVTVTMNSNKGVTANFSAIAETISTPSTPSGPMSGTTGSSYSYSTGGSTSSLGHAIQYRFDWGDGTTSDWSSSATASKSWAEPGRYSIKAQARCGSCLTVLSGWSTSLGVTVESPAGYLEVNPPNGWDSSGTAGGPFTPSNQTYTLKNTGGTAISWAASKVQSWVSLSTENGSLAPGASATVAVSINENANALGLGSYSDSVAFNNVTNGGGNSTHPVKLTVHGVTVAHRITSNPSGMEVVVDGVTHKTPKRFNWETGSSHVVSVPSPQGGIKRRYNFYYWSDNGTAEHTIVAPSSSTIYTAYFTTQFNLTTEVNNVEGGMVSLYGVEGGTVDPLGGVWCDEGQAVTLSASPYFDHYFHSWVNKSGTVISKQNPLTVTMTGPKTLKAKFKQITYPLVVTIEPRNSGTVARNPKKSGYIFGEQVTVTAKPKVGYTFAGWSGEVSSAENQIALTMDGSKSIQANFVVDENRPRATEESSSSVQEQDPTGLPLVGKLESPVDGKNTSGVKAIYGWALDEKGISKIELFIDGSYVCKIPHGGIREDIKGAYPRYPKADQSGFAMIWNYAMLSPGEHDVVVKVHSLKGEILDLASKVNVVRFHGEVVTQIAPEGYLPYQVDVTADGLTKSYDVSVEWCEETQDFGISEIIPKE